MQPSDFRHVHTAAVVALAVAGVARVARAQASSTWLGSLNNSWSLPANWVTGVIPGNGGTATFLTPPQVFTTSTRLDVVQDQFGRQLSGLIFNSSYQYALTGSPITLGGGATLHIARPAIETLTTSYRDQQIDLALNGNAGLTKTGPGIISLSQASSFNGPVNLNDGTLTIGAVGDAALGNPLNGINFNGGTLRTGTFGTNRTLNLVGNGTLDSTVFSAPITLTGQVIGPGSLTKFGIGNLNINSPLNYSGATNLMAGTTTLGSNGALTNTSSVAVRSQLTLDNSGQSHMNRLNDATSLRLVGAALVMKYGFNGGSESVAATVFDRGLSVVGFTQGSSGTVSLGTVTRENSGLAFFDGEGLGMPTGSTKIFMSTPTLPLAGGGGSPGSKNISIFPWAAGRAGVSDSTFVTYGPDGVRPLNVATEYATSIVPTSPGLNVRLAGSNFETVNTDCAVNALIVRNFGISGVGELTITSGALIAGGTISVALHFREVEGIILADSLTIAGPISGTGGLTISGSTTFTAASTYTGPTTISSGSIAFTRDVPNGAPSPFGADTSAILLAPGRFGANILYKGTTPATFDRGLIVSARTSTNNVDYVPQFGATSPTSLTMNGQITLDDSPLALVSNSGSRTTFNGNIIGRGSLTTFFGGVITLNGNNTFDGGGEMQTGTWELGSDTALGTGTFKSVGLGRATIAAVNGPRTIANDFIGLATASDFWTIGGSDAITFTGSIDLGGTYTHTINNAADTTYAGVLHTGGINKAGVGRLILSGDNTYSGPTTVSNGVLRVAHPRGLGATTAGTMVANATTLEITGDALSDEPVTINGIGFQGDGRGAIACVEGNNRLGDITVATTASIKSFPGSSLSVGNVDGNSDATLIKSGTGPLIARRLRVGGLNVTDSGTLAIEPGRNADKTSVVTGNLTINASSRFDLGDNDLIVDYTTTSPLPKIATYVAAAYNAGAWTHAGITTSQGLESRHALGVAESSQVFTSFPAVFSGVSVDSTAVLVRWTRYGDANLDGVVNLLDFNALAANFNAANKLWSDGDFDYDGNVNLIDFNQLAANFNLAALTVDPTPQDWANLAAAIPEPAATTAMLTVSAISCLRRRRRAC